MSEAAGPAGVAALLALAPGQVVTLYYRVRAADAGRVDPLEALGRVNRKQAVAGRPPVPCPDWFWPSPGEM